MGLHIIEKIDPLTFGKVNAMFGLIIGLILGIFSLIAAGMVSSFLSSPSVSTALTSQTFVDYNPQIVVQIQQLGFYGLIMFLLSGVIAGFVGGVAIALIYNLAAKLVGGVKIETKEE